MVECVPPWDGTVHEEGGQVFELDGQLARLPAPAAAPFARHQVAAAVCEALNAAPRLLPSEVQPAEVEHAVAALAPLSAGGLKSLLQKALRFHARRVDLGFGAAGGGATLPTPLVAAVGVALLFAERGSFSPELQACAVHAWYTPCVVTYAWRVHVHGMRGTPCVVRHAWYLSRATRTRHAWYTHVRMCMYACAHLPCREAIGMCSGLGLLFREVPRARLEPRLRLRRRLCRGLLLPVRLASEVRVEPGRARGGRTWLGLGQGLGLGLQLGLELG